MSKKQKPTAWNMWWNQPISKERLMLEKRGWQVSRTISVAPWPAAWFAWPPLGHVAFSHFLIFYFENNSPNFNLQIVFQNLVFQIIFRILVFFKKSQLHIFFILNFFFFWVPKILPFLKKFATTFFGMQFS